jgi:hypothetical protein
VPPSLDRAWRGRGAVEASGEGGQRFCREDYRQASIEIVMFGR